MTDSAPSTPTRRRITTAPARPLQQRQQWQTDRASADVVDFAVSFYRQVKTTEFDFRHGHGSSFS